MILRHRANINKAYTKRGDVYLYEDHRTILNVLFLKKKNNELECPVNIILFDNHDDGCVPSTSALEKIDLLNNEADISIRDFWNFTEFDLKGLDDDWIKAGMELNLIENVFLFNSCESKIYFVEEYETKKFGTKKIYNLGNIWDCISYKGYLNDIIKKEYSQLWEDFGWVIEEGRFYFEPKRKFIVDFDLDCFSTEVLGKRIAIPTEILYEKMTKYQIRDYHYYGSSQELIQDFIDKAEFTTICFETQFCGGYLEAFKIFQSVNDLFFDNKIE